MDGRNPKPSRGACGRPQMHAIISPTDTSHITFAEVRRLSSFRCESAHRYLQAYQWSEQEEAEGRHGKAVSTEHRKHSLIASAASFAEVALPGERRDANACFGKRSHSHASVEIQSLRLREQHCRAWPMPRHFINLSTPPGLNSVSYESSECVMARHTANCAPHPYNQIPLLGTPCRTAGETTRPPSQSSSTRRTSSSDPI